MDMIDPWVLVDSKTGECVSINFDTEDEALQYVALLPGYEDGRYYLDGPEADGEMGQ